mmetsp:Transcript_15121/g.20043  ORF Transcript_15121/g.20043 Transcript_15121/m.20043 type:complete len:981 (+) Transcript_15121:67-3009(+)
MYNRYRREKQEVEYERTTTRGDGGDYYDPETQSRRYSGVDILLDDSKPSPPALRRPFDYEEDSDKDEYGDSGEGGYRGRNSLSSKQVDAEVDDIVANMMDIHIINHPRELARRKRLSAIVGTVVIAIVFFCVTLVDTKDGYEKQDKSSSRDGFGDSPMIDLNVAAPTNLPVLCSITSISTAVGHDQCEKACEAARCCTAAGEDSCFLDKEALCGTYSPCGTLNTQMETPSQKDSILNNAVNIKDPQHPHGVEVSPPPSNLPYTCNSINLQTPDGYLDCETACHHGSCCLATTTGPRLFDKGSCFETHPDLCGGYETCLNLDTIKPGPSGSEAVNLKCSMESVATKDGRETCEHLCAVRSCCFANDERNCRSTNKNWCNEYSACEVLITEKENNSYPKPSTESENDNIDAPTPLGCQAHSLITQEDLVFCENICKPALCCYFGDSCTHDIKCHDFKFCDHVLSAFLNGVTWESSGGDMTTPAVVKHPDVTVNNGPPVPPSPNSGGSTTASVTNTAENNAYYAGVGEGVSNSNESSEDQEDLGYEFSNLYDDIDNEDIDIDNTFLQQKPLNSNSPLDILCAPENLMAYPGLCELHCADHMCCFDNGPDGCMNHPSCPSLGACTILINNYNTDPEEELTSSTNTAVTQHVKATPEEVQKRCARSKLVEPSGVHSCISACEDYLCCFDDGKNGCNTWNECHKYQACKFISDNFKDDTQDAMVKLQDACTPASIEEIGLDECIDLCTPYHCCVDGSCSYGPDCKVYSSICSVAFEAMDKADEIVIAEEVFVEPPGDLEWRCNRERIRIDPELQIQCDHPCEYARCCDDTDPAAYNCKGSRPLMCQAYRACFQQYVDDDYEDYDDEEEAPLVVNTQPQNNRPGVQSGQTISTQNTQPSADYNTPPETLQKNNEAQPSKPVSSGGDGDSTNEITELCSKEHTQTQKGIDACKAACQKMSCCWEPDPSLNCYNQNEDTCRLYLHCFKG